MDASLTDAVIAQEAQEAQKMLKGLFDKGPTEDQLAKKLQEEKRKRMEVCAKEIQESLRQHKCDLVATVRIVGQEIQTGTIVVAQ